MGEIGGKQKLGGREELEDRVSVLVFSLLKYTRGNPVGIYNCNNKLFTQFCYRC